MAYLQRFGPVLLVASCAALSACGGGDDPPPTQADTTFGRIQGVDDSAGTGTYAWKGIPFAKPPVGALRWMAPVDPDPWTTTLATTQFANPCVQYGRIYGPGTNNTYDATIGTTLNQAVGNEDCLYLNVWRPANGQANLPVIVFIHGGSNVSGYTADPVYDGATLAKTANAVVVTVNYRVGIFGWLDVPQLKHGTNANDDSGNFAVLDNIKALQFINRNIAAFGGNAGNVTVMGQSAGAIDVYALLTSPLMVNANPRLMHRAVPLSGGISLASNLPAGSIPTLNPASTALAQGNALLNNQLIVDGLATDTASAQAYVATQTPAQIAAYLRGKTPATLLTTLLTKLAALGLAGSGPIPEGVVVPVDPVGAINAGNYLKVPVLAGNTRDEAKLFPTFLALAPALGGVSGRLVSDATLFSTQFSYNPDAAPTVAIGSWIPAQYLPVTTPVTGFNAETDLLNSIFFGNSRDNVLNALKAKQPESGTTASTGTRSRRRGTTSTARRTPSTWRSCSATSARRCSPTSPTARPTSPAALDLSDAMMKSVGAFAKNGDPNNAALGVAWPAWPSKLIFDATPTVKSISVQ